jgi:RNA polymerase sigma-70 factor (ECF subfamily)
MTTTLDENIILRMAQGDKSAFQQLYRQTSSAVYGFALSILKNRHDAEDVMHDTYIRAYTAAVSYKPMGTPMAWLLTIVRNLAYNKIRAGKVCEDLSQYEHLAGPSDTESVLDKVILEQAMEVLDFQERQIVILHAMTGLRHREIAEILDVPPGTVRSKYKRALDKMRKELEEKYEHEERGTSV